MAILIFLEMRGVKIAAIKVCFGEINKPHTMKYTLETKTDRDNHQC